MGCTKWASNPPFLLCPACLPAHENSQPTTRSAEAVKFNQGGAVKKTSTGAAGATKFNQVGTVAKSVTNIRKGMCFLRHFVFCYMSVKIRLVATCRFQTCYNLLKQLAASLWITSFENQLETSLLTTCKRLVVNKLSQAMRAHPNIYL